MVTTRAAARSSSSSASASATASTPSAPAAAAATDGIDAVSKARTIAHMNASHRADLAAILRHRAGLTAAQAGAAPELLDLDLASLRVRDDGGAGTVHVVPLAPPMASWADRRARLVDMTKEARRALGIEEEEEGGEGGKGHGAGAGEKVGAKQAAREGKEKEKEVVGTRAAAGAVAPTVAFYPPQGAGIVSFTGVLWYFMSAAAYFSGNLAPGSPLWRLIEAAHFPGGAASYVWLVRMILVPVLGIHLFEAAYLMAVRRLAPLGVPVGSTMWLLWVGCVFVEGLPAWQRFDQKVLGKQKAL